MEYTEHCGTSNAVFYYGNTNGVFHYGEVFVNSLGDIERVRILDNNGNVITDGVFVVEEMQRMGITRIAYKTERCVNIPLDEQLMNKCLKNGERPVRKTGFCV